MFGELNLGALISLRFEDTNLGGRINMKPTILTLVYTVQVQILKCVAISCNEALSFFESGEYNQYLSFLFLFFFRSKEESMKSSKIEVIN